MEIDKNQKSLILKKDNNTGIVLSEDNKILENIIKSKNHFCYAVFDESSPKINDITDARLFVEIKIILTNVALFMNIQEPSLGLSNTIANGIRSRYSYYRIAEVGKALEMGSMSELLDEEGKYIKCYNNINGVWVFACLKAYHNMRIDEVYKLNIEKSSLHRKIEAEEIKENLASDEFWEKKIKERKEKMKSEGKIITSYESYRENKMKYFKEVADKREINKKNKKK